MSEMFTWWLAPAGQETFVHLFLDFCLKGTAVLCLAMLFAWILRHRPAGARELVWRCALLALLALPASWLCLPSWKVLSLEGTVGTAPDPAVRGGSPGPVESRSEEFGSPPRSAGPRTTAATAGIPFLSDTPRRPDPARAPDANGDRLAWLPFLWLAGAALALVPLVAAMWRSSRAVASARPAATSARTLAHEAARDLGLKKIPRIRVSDRVPVPMLWHLGPLGRPVILLPESAAHWDSSRLRAVFAHECAHVVRGDCLTRLVARLGVSLAWFHPLAWFGLSRMRLAAEHACDEAAVVGGHRPSDYAGHLLAIALSPGDVHGIQSAAVPMARAGEMQKRINALLAPGSRRSGPSRRSHLLALSLVLGLAVPGGMLRGTKGPARNVSADPVEQADAARSAAARGLAWLARNQDPTSGGWRAHVGLKFNSRYEVTSSDKPHVGVSALVLDAFVRAGNLPGTGPHGATVRRGAEFLYSALEPRSGFINAHGSRVKSHALATYTLIDIADRIEDRPAVQRMQPAVDFLVRIQLKGGWRYQPLMLDTDLLHVTAGLRALRRASKAGLKVPDAALRAAERALARFERRKSRGTRGPGYAYQDLPQARVTYGCTAEGLEVRLQGSRRDPEFETALVESLAGWHRTARLSPDHFLFWHAIQHHAQALHLFARRGPARTSAWKPVRKSFASKLLGLQQPDGRWTCKTGPGAAYATAVACTVLLLD